MDPLLAPLMTIPLQPHVYAPPERAQNEIFSMHVFQIWLYMVTWTVVNDAGSGSHHQGVVLGAQRVDGKLILG